MVNFDNAATTFPKPVAVKKAVAEALEKYGGNPGRSGHRLSMETASAVFHARNECAAFFGAEPENTIFTLNCTHALNLAIKGVMSDGGHIVTSDMEHNSVIRPINALKGCRMSIAHIYDDDDKTFAAFDELVTPETRAVVCTSASNVTGKIPPFKRIAKMCQRKGVCFILDGAQGCGVIPIEIGNGINFICTAGHKGLYGPAGTGLLITDGKYPLSTIIEGGTGSDSLLYEQPAFLPDRLEAGTINTVGIIGLGRGVAFVREKGIENIVSFEDGLCRMFTDGLGRMNNVRVYRSNIGNYVSVVSFNIYGKTPNEVASELSEEGFCLRGGLHCAGIAHRTLGTAPDGTVRFAPSVFNNAGQTAALIAAIKKISQKA